MEVDSRTRLLGGIGFSGRFEASYYTDRKRFDHDDYNMMGSSWWGHDWTWAVILGLEGSDYTMEKNDCPPRNGSSYVNVTYASEPRTPPIGDDLWS